MTLRTCISPEGRFVYGVHKPAYEAENLRCNDYVASLGTDQDGRPVLNDANFPPGKVKETEGEWIIEIPNAFPFRGTTYLIKRIADRHARDPKAIRLPEAPGVSVTDSLAQWLPSQTIDSDTLADYWAHLPEPLQLAIAATSTDPRDLVPLADLSCEFEYDPRKGVPVGLKYTVGADRPPRARIKNRSLFETLANNPHLPDVYKEVMVLRPGVQGGSEIVGEWRDAEAGSHVFEYLRRNSYIPWGHYAANMAHDAVRYRIADMQPADMIGMRHLYYQRVYLATAGQLGIETRTGRSPLSAAQLETLRCRIMERLTADNTGHSLQFNSTLWGWNFGADFAPSGYRLHASHQQIHQQYALIPAEVEAQSGDAGTAGPPAAYACGDLVYEFARRYERETGRAFFDAYLQAIDGNRRMDGRSDRDSSLAVYQDERVLAFVPKAQTSQWEIQIITRKPGGNVLETDTATRQSLDRALWVVMNGLEKMGVRMVTGIEYAKRFDRFDVDQRLIYVLLPRLPQSPGAFSESQLRWINGHYPEDFAAACRSAVKRHLTRLTGWT